VCLKEKFFIKEKFLSIFSSNSDANFWKKFKMLFTFCRRRITALQ
jgi:hypothetical protein